MKKCVAVSVMILCLLIPAQHVKAQVPILEIIKQGIKKVIKAVDLQIQRFQNETIWLQNAQKTLENVMSKTKLTEISDWVEKHRQLYDDYFQELWKVKAVLTYYHRVKEIIEKQKQLVREFDRAYNLARRDENFTPEEVQRMYKVYSSILDESLKNLDQVFLVINSFATQMSDGKRMEIINTVSDAMDNNLRDLREFNSLNIGISLNRAKEKGDIDIVKKLYDLQ